MMTILFFISALTSPSRHHTQREWYRADSHTLDASEAGYATEVKKVMTSEGERRADIKISGIGVLQHDDLVADATVRHDFIGAGRDGGQRHGMLRNPDRPDQILAQAAAEKIRQYRNPYRNNRAVAFLPLCRNGRDAFTTSSCVCCTSLRTSS